MSEFLSGYTEEEIGEREHLAVEDVKAIIEYQAEKDPDAFEKLRKWRQKKFIDEAWKIINVGQEIMLKGLKSMSNSDKATLSSASSAANIVTVMIDRIRALESKTKTREKKFELNRDEREGLKKAQVRIEQKETEHG